jgi:hypothetical protein
MLCFEIKLLREIVRAFFHWRYGKKVPQKLAFAGNLPEWDDSSHPIDDWRITNGILRVKHTAQQWPSRR